MLAMIVWVSGIIGGLMETLFLVKNGARPWWLKKIYWPLFFIAFITIIFLKSVGESLQVLGLPFVLIVLLVSALVVFGLRKLGDIIRAILSATEGE